VFVDVTELPAVGMNQASGYRGRVGHMIVQGNNHGLPIIGWPGIRQSDTVQDNTTFESFHR
jgi:hypothetical protein